MAPFVGPDRGEVIRLLSSAFARSKLPITLGLYSPQAVIEYSDDRWRLIPLEIDREKARAAGEEALAKGEMWMPESEWRFLEKQDPIIETESKQAFIEELQKIDWPYSEK